MNTTRIKQALLLTRDIVTDKIEGIEEDCCLHDKKTNAALIETMDDMAKPDYRRCLRAVKLIDDAITEIET